MSDSELSFEASCLKCALIFSFVQRAAHKMSNQIGVRVFSNASDAEKRGSDALRDKLKVLTVK